ncbi:unnamed protein product [Caenorhabditis angaria]|uniref:Protein FAM76A n=1 Tax=Caenorhabditis angaria TaxID=860376 RepID=A0A9P1I8A6_9PELO|nr:unnamed protein product [Caenorhabditis angaria]
MSGPVVKNCLNCRIALGENTNGAIQCPKCQKNEAKYGKATVCQFCKLNAAFHEKKCVWCAHSERKFGDPIHCANCKLKCAFPKNSKARKAENQSLCRLCIMQARQTKQTHLSGIPVPLDSKEKKENQNGGSSHNHSSSSNKNKRKHEKEESTPAKYGRPGTTTTTSLSAMAAEVLPDFESQNKIQKLNDEIGRLNAVIQTKETQLLEKDKIISNLKADNYNQEKKHRERVQQLQKEKEESIRMIEQIRNKASKK